MSELRTIARHAGTVLVGQLATMAFGVTDTIVAGRYAEVSLAALSVGSAIYMSVYVALMGVLQALLPAWSELHGKARTGSVGHLSARRCLSGSRPGPVGAPGVPGPAGHVAAAGRGCYRATCCATEVLLAGVREYLGVLALALPPALLFRMYSTLNQSLGKPLLVTWLQGFARWSRCRCPSGLPSAAWDCRPRRGWLCLGHAARALHAGLALWLLRTQQLYRPYACGAARATRLAVSATSRAWAFPAGWPSWSKSPRSR